jgi:hypothetical protein
VVALCQPSSSSWLRRYAWRRETTFFALSLSSVANLRCHLHSLLEPKPATHSTRQEAFLPLLWLLDSVAVLD